MKKKKKKSYRVENIVRKREITCYKQFLLFSQYFPQLYSFNASKCGIVGNGLNSIPKKPVFLLVCSTNLLKTLWYKEKLLVTSNFSFSNSAFYPLRELFTTLIESEIVVC